MGEAGWPVANRGGALHNSCSTRFSAVAVTTERRACDPPEGRSPIPHNAGPGKSSEIPGPRIGLTARAVSAESRPTRVSASRESYGYGFDGALLSWVAALLNTLPMLFRSTSKM